MVLVDAQQNFDHRKKPQWHETTAYRKRGYLVRYRPGAMETTRRNRERDTCGSDLPIISLRPSREDLKAVQTMSGDFASSKLGIKAE